MRLFVLPSSPDMLTGSWWECAANTQGLAWSEVSGSGIERGEWSLYLGIIIQPWKNTWLSKADRWTLCWVHSCTQGSLRPVLLHEAVHALGGTGWHSSFLFQHFVWQQQGWWAPERWDSCLNTLGSAHVEGLYTWSGFSLVSFVPLALLHLNPSVPSSEHLGGSSWQSFRAVGGFAQAGSLWRAETAFLKSSAQQLSSQSLHERMSGCELSSDSDCEPVCHRHLTSRKSHAALQCY